ncbi:PF07588 family protein [Leptospira santarosai str. CBC1416]|uniref:PF07588 family protein n=1 Tax=Leptospira santarosai str. CBC1416 TaxID=1193059 RepID=M6VGU4_9LEPT|nr:PF07588 family protein [Leptospira santarosai str. CBC1416]
MLELKRKSIIPFISEGMRILKLSVNRIAALLCSQSASNASGMSRSRKPFQKQNRGPRYKKVYSIFFIWITVLLIGCSGENSNSSAMGAISMGSIKDSFLNLIHSHSSNQSLIPSSGLYVFVSSYTNNASVPPLSHNGNFGGIAGADAYCNSHIPTSLTGTGSYKAMLVDGKNRVATTVGQTSSTGQKDWVFEKNTSYYRADGDLVFTTNDAGLFDFSNGSLTRPFADVFYLYDFGIWTGLQSNWKTAASTQLCSSASQPWTSGSSPVRGSIGYANYNSSASISTGSIPCQWTSAQDPNSQGSMEMGVLCVQEKPITLKGRIGFLEDEQCHHSNSPFTIPWKQCHEFKRHFDPVTGAAISSDVAAPESFRPVPGQVHLNFFNSAQTNPAGCYISNLQSDLDGNVSGQIDNCLKSNPAPDSVRITLVLDYKTNLAYNGSIGTIRSVWEKTRITALNYLPYDQSRFFQTLFVEPNSDQAMVEPYFEVLLPLSSYWNAATKTYELGTVNLLSSVPKNMASSMRVTLSNWQGTLEFHNRLKNESLDKIQFDMFLNDSARNCVRCYTINFVGTQGTSANTGNLILTAPNANNLPTIYPVDRPLGHEFGHTVTFSAAPWLIPPPVHWAGQFRNSSNQNYARVDHGNEYQDMKTALFEGIVNPIGRYLISGNQGNWQSDQYYLGTDQKGWQLNPVVDQPNSDYQRFRYEMWARGIAENSPEWTSRWQGISNVGNSFTDYFTNSNNEFRYDGFVHYLLQTAPYHIDSYFATGVIAPYMYQVEYRYDQMKLLGEILDGRPANFKWVSYGDVVHPKNSRVSLKDLLVTLGEMHNGSPLPQDGSPGFTDAYLSIKSPFSPQSLGWRLVQKGLISKDEVNNLYRAVGMDQLANICGYPWALPNCQ